MRMAHPDEGVTVSCEIGQVVRRFGEQARILLPASIRFDCVVAAEPMLAILNPEGLEHALWNLVINARQAMPSGGAIQLRCEARRHQISIAVADDGQGIPAEIQDRIFDPYFTTKPPGQGTGLGLTAVARFARASNGAVQVESAPGRGTTFRLHFPRSQGAPAAAGHPVAGRSGVA
jgi:signal transduction histidine kinase